jgi:hypothetical protein
LFSSGFAKHAEQSRTLESSGLVSRPTQARNDLPATRRIGSRIRVIAIKIHFSWSGWQDLNLLADTAGLFLLAAASVPLPAFIGTFAV